MNGRGVMGQRFTDALIQIALCMRFTRTKRKARKKND